MAKRNPADLTKRNNDARKRDIAKLLARVKAIEAFVRMMKRRGGN